MTIECRSPRVSKGVTTTATSIVFVLSLLLCVTAVQTFAQETPPTPGPAKSVNIPAVKETKLKNGLTVAVIEKKGVPVVSVQLLVKAGASSEGMEKAGLANLAADMLTKGTKTRTAEQIAEEMEFLGSSINSGAGWNSSNVGMTVTTDKLDAAMAIFADVVLNPSFKQAELDLLKSQTLDDLKASLQQPGFLANYVASEYSFGEHPIGGTQATLASISQDDVAGFYSKNFYPDESILIFVGDIASTSAVSFAEKYLNGWIKPYRSSGAGFGNGTGSVVGPKPIVGRFLIVDLPNSGQASVNYFKRIIGTGRAGKEFYIASVLNSLLGGGYSSRLNQEIRIKRGLSYGAGSRFGWRGSSSTFGASAQTKDVSGAEVAELVIAEINRLRDSDATDADITPRKAVLTGGFGRNLETNQGLAGALGDLYSFGIPTTELNAYVANVNGVQNSAIRSFAQKNFVNGDIIIVGDYEKFKDDLTKRFPNAKVEVIKASEIDITKPNLRK